MPSFEASLAAIDALGEELDDDVYTAINIETTRALRLRTSLHLEVRGRPLGLVRGAALGGARWAWGWLQKQSRPSAPEQTPEEKLRLQKQAQPSAPDSSEKLS